MNQKEHCVGIFVDLKKAFNTVNHEVLLGQLDRCGVRGLPLRWLSSYLRGRQQFVTIDGHCSQQRTIEVGVPQGSILGPIPIVIYINDLPNASSFLWPILYADDTSFLASKHSYAELIQSINAELPKIYQWTTANRLSISYDKT